MISLLPAHKARPIVDSYLVPHQFDVGALNGTEPIAHAVCYLCQHPELRYRVIIRIDIYNKFNRISKQSFLNYIPSRTLGIAQWVKYCYGYTTELPFGSYPILNAYSTQQVDYFVPLFFLALNPLNQALTAVIFSAVNA